MVPLLNKAGCSSRDCHGSFQGQKGFRLSLFGYDLVLDHRELTKDEGKGPRVDPKAGERSLFLIKPQDDEKSHEGGERLKKDTWQYRLLLQWVLDGAKFVSRQEAYLDRLQILPDRLVSSVGDKPASLQVIGHFSDGTREDVTELTRFSTNNAGVAGVDDAGSVSFAGLGDTHIVASYGPGVGTCQVLVPRKDGENDFPEFTPNNRIDELVGAKLRKLGIHPSALCADEEFLRRVHVDLIGTLPAVDEVRAFLADTRVDKRARLIDQLLERPGYALYWSTLFSDWTGNNRVVLNPDLKVMWLWHDWFRDKLSRNVPYDEMVEGIITATSREGRCLEEYLEEVQTVYGNYMTKDGRKNRFDDGTYGRRRTLDLYWMKRGGQPESYAIRTASVFLGIQIQCAQCHKHPFDRWTRTDFDSFTSFFRVTRVASLEGGPGKGIRMEYHQVAVYPGPEDRWKPKVGQVPPKILGGAEVPYAEGGPDPRLALWEWMSAPDNPTFVPSIVNRIWGHHLGIGIVEPLDDFNQANPPSNPALLEWLSADFRGHGFDLKRLHRLILNSRTYQLSHRPTPSNRNDNRNFSHRLVRRMPAEVLYDAIAWVTGIDHEYSSTFVPMGTRAIGLGAGNILGRRDAEYAMHVFGRPKREMTSICERSNEPSLAQALFLINDANVHSRVADPNGRLPRLLEANPENDSLIDELYLTCLTRFPSEQERTVLRDYFAGDVPRLEAAQDVLWSLMNVREFIFVP